VKFKAFTVLWIKATFVRETFLRKRLRNSRCYTGTICSMFFAVSNTVEQEIIVAIITIALLIFTPSDVHQQSTYVQSKPKIAALL